MTDIFISYGNDGISKKIAREFSRKMQQSTEVQVFYDLDVLKPGDRIDQTIKLAITSSKAVVQFISRKTLSSKYVREEILYALKNRMPIIPVIVESQAFHLLRENAELAPLLDYQCLDFTKDKDWDTLIDACKQLSRFSRSQFTRTDKYLDDAARLANVETNEIYAVRTLLLGPGGAGKSSLADRLQGKPVEQIKTATLGIEYQNHQPLDLQKNFPESNPEEKDLNLYLWDFGGQTIFHGLHRAFLHENCVYILVVDSRHEQVPDEWLHQIRHLAGGNATVLLVTNQHDGCDIRQNETRLLREFPDLLDNNSFYYFSCIDSTASELTTFVNELTKTGLDSQKTVWKETLNVHQAIREYTENKSAVFISMTQIKKIISDNGRVEDSKAMINSLEQLGFLASITKGKLSYCLKPEWAVDRAYELLYSDTLRDSAGKLDLLNFDECFETEPTEGQQSKLLDFLDHRSLCFQLPESGEYFFPDAATADEPRIVSDLLKQQQRLQIRFDLPYLPLGFHTRLVKPLFDQEAGIKGSQYIWRQGFITQHAESYAIVQYLLRKSSIEVTLVGNPEYYAALLDKFYVALSSAVAESKTGLQFAIRPFVFLEKGLFELDRTKESQAFSVHSVVELVNVLQAANGDLKQVYEDVRDMAADKKGDTHYHTNINGDGQTAVGSDNATMNQYIDKSYTEITADQRHQIATIVGELLKDAGSLPTEQLIAVTETKKALEAPVDDAVSQNLLGKVVDSIDGVATFTKDKALPIAEFAIKHKEALGTALAAAKTACNL